MNADDRLSLDPLGPVEGGNRIVEGSHVADVCPQPTNPDPLDELTQLGAIGYDDEVDSQAARGPRLCRAGDGHQRSSGANQARRPLPDVAADVDERLTLDTATLGPGRHFALQVKGDSMIHAGIHDGDYVLVRQQDTAEPGAIVVALLGDDATVKYLRRRGRQVRLEAANPAYRPIPLHGHVPAPRILGRVVGLYRTFR